MEVELRKICPTPARKSGFEVKIVKTPWVWTFLGALLEVELRKICATLWRESDLEVKIVKNCGSRDVFGGSKCVLRGKRKDFDMLQNTRQAQEFVRVAKMLAGVVGLKKVQNDAVRVATAMISL